MMWFLNMLAVFACFFGFIYIVVHVYLVLNPEHDSLEEQERSERYTKAWHSLSEETRRGLSYGAWCRERECLESCPKPISIWRVND